MLLVGLPQCSTCKGIEKILKNKGYDYVYRDITTETPSAEELEAWFEKAQEPSFKKIVNTSGQKYREWNVKEALAQAADLKEQFSIIAKDGMLIKRPILVLDSGDVYWGASVQTFVDTLLEK